MEKSDIWESKWRQYGSQMESTWVKKSSKEYRGARAFSSVPNLPIAGPLKVTFGHHYDQFFKIDFRLPA